jgi:hypothetical protein
MRCPTCNDPMPQTRYEPGQFKVFTCNRCRYTKKRTENYSGQVIINSRVPLRHQE